MNPSISQVPKSSATLARTVFTREELKEALAEDRVFTYDPPLHLTEEYEGHRLVSYPYVLFANYVQPSRCLIADAWHVNDRGEIYPGHISPVPVVLSEVSSIELAPRPTRQKLLAHVQQSRNQFAGFVNEPTMRVAQTLASDARAWAYLAEQVKANDPNWHVQAGNKLHTYASMHRRLFSPNPIALCDVDWSEVAAQFESTPQPMAEATPPSTPAPQVLTSTSLPTAEKDLDTETLTREIPQDVLHILRACRAEGMHLYLPRVQLERKLYDRVDQVLRDLGGKWVGGSRRAHVFEHDAGAILEAAVVSGRFLRPADLGFFPTPAALVTKVLAKARLERGMSVLEPQAGRGAIAIPMAAAVGGVNLVNVCDLMERNVQHLRSAGFTNVLHGDFLKQKPIRGVLAACMNPPFSRMQDIDHVLHASRFLRPSGTVTSIMSRTWMTSQTKKAVEFRRFIDTVKADVEEIDAGAFREAGTNVATTLVHFTV